MFESSPLTGSLSQGTLYDNYVGIGGASALKDLNLLDEYGNNIINATNQIDENLYYYSFAAGGPNKMGVGASVAFVIFACILTIAITRIIISKKIETNLSIFS